ncbi:MAG TPA: hypothetical protein VFY89_04250 [Ktedonobacterales bacterium]
MNPMTVLAPCQAAGENPFVIWPQIAAGCGLVLLGLAAALWFGRRTTAQPHAGRGLAILATLGGLWGLLLALWTTIEAATYSGGCALYVQSWPVAQPDAESVTASVVVLTVVGTLALLVAGLVRLRARQKTVRLP